MAVNRVISLICDGCAADVGNENRVSKVRAIAAKIGWIKRRGLDYCPECAKRMPKRAQKRAWQII